MRTDRHDLATVITCTHFVLRFEYITTKQCVLLRCLTSASHTVPSVPEENFGTIICCVSVMTYLE